MIMGKKNLWVKSEEVCGNRLYTLYTVVAAMGGGGQRSGGHHGLSNFFVS